MSIKKYRLDLSRWQGRCARLWQSPLALYVLYGIFVVRFVIESVVCYSNGWVLIMMIFVTVVYLRDGRCYTLGTTFPFATLTIYPTMKKEAPALGTTFH